MTIPVFSIFCISYVLTTDLFCYTLLSIEVDFDI